MANKLFVAGLDYAITNERLSEIFAAAGTVVSAQVIIDHDTGQSKGFGFVEMSSSDEAANAIATLNDQQVDGRSLLVKEARPKGDNPYRNNNSGPRGRNNNSRNGYRDNKSRGGYDRRSR
jgi:RNA recognition motif-containing protein